MMGVEAIPALFFVMMVIQVPESPRWLLLYKGNQLKAVEVLKMIYAENEMESELKTILKDSNRVGKRQTIFQPEFRKPLLLAFFIAFFNQFSGINAFLYYAPRIFREAGLEESTAFLSSVGIGLTNLLFTLIGLALIDRWGRKQLMFVGSVGYIISLIMIALAFASDWTGMVVPGFLFLFIAAHAIGQGAVIWVFIAEIFPNHLRAQGQAFGSSVHWILAAIIPSLMPWLMNSVGASPVFSFFALMMVLQLIWVWKKMPETKGVELEEMGRIT
jgi:sugar porter (SP) family MFS transporter